MPSLLSFPFSPHSGLLPPKRSLKEADLLDRSILPVMGFPPRLALPLTLLLLSLSLPSYAKLTEDYYAKTCPQFEEIVREAVVDKQTASPTTAAAALRVLVHDCLVNGCDGSVLVASTAFNKAERDHELNLNLPGDAFDVVTRAKTNLELTCPGTVSCADILVQATRDLIKMVGGPFYQVRLGRKDSFVSNISHVDGNLPTSSMNMDQVLELFKRKGFSAQELVALIGGHTIGFSHCKEFAHRIFNFSKTSPVDPALHPAFAERLKTFCAHYEAQPALAAFNDPVSPGTFDNNYYQNLNRGLALLPIDVMIRNDPRTGGFAQRYASNQTEFFRDFSQAIGKLSRLEVKIGHDGEVRHKCDAFNTVKT